MLTEEGEGSTATPCIVSCRRGKGACSHSPDAVAASWSEGSSPKLRHLKLQLWSTSGFDCDPLLLTFAKSWFWLTLHVGKAGLGLPIALGGCFTTSWVAACPYTFQSDVFQGIPVMPVLLSHPLRGKRSEPSSWGVTMLQFENHCVVSWGQVHLLVEKIITY